MKNRRAMTLLEVLMALAIFAIAVVAMIEATAYQTRTTRLAEETTRATMLARDLVAEIHTTTTLEKESDSGEFDGANSGFSWKYEIATTDVEGLSRLTVTVSWKDGRALRERRIEEFWAKP